VVDEALTAPAGVWMVTKDDNVVWTVLPVYFGEVRQGFAGLTFGWVGVNLFLVLSGFLIGSIILERKDSSNFLSVFYSRRAPCLLQGKFRRSLRNSVRL
jgi:hypothetical protein